jgi:hypothetical protein
MVWMGLLANVEKPGTKVQLAQLAIREPAATREGMVQLVWLARMDTSLWTDHLVTRDPRDQQV